MAKTETITFRTDEDMKRKLIQIAQELDRTLSWVINTQLKEIMPPDIKARPTVEDES